MNSNWTLATTSPIYTSNWPLPNRGTFPIAPVLLGYWRDAQFAVDMATGDVWYRVLHDPVWMHYSKASAWLETRAGRDYMRTIQTSTLSTTA